jgi:hypothetical protein
MGEGRQVEVGLGIDARPSRNVLGAKKDDEVYVEGNARLAVEHRGDAAADEVSKVCGFERADEQLDEVRFGH